MGSHRGDDEGFRAVCAEPVPCGLGNGHQIGNPPTPRGYGYLALGWFFFHLVQSPMDLVGNVLKRGRDKLLLHLKNVHPIYPSKIIALDESVFLSQSRRIGNRVSAMLGKG
jgi:hypothetical protein